jgi:uncharacterized protein (TIGR00369 family)
MKGKTTKESRVVTTLLLSPEDANPSGNVHGGVIMRLIDTAAAIVAGRHCNSNAVTASVDRIDFHNPGYMGEALTLTASLNLVGRTSMEIGVRVESENLQSSEKRHIASAYLTFVSLDANRRPQEVPPLILEDEVDKRRNQEAMNRRRIRLAEKKTETK